MFKINRALLSYALASVSSIKAKAFVNTVRAVVVPGIMFLLSRLGAGSNRPLFLQSDGAGEFCDRGIDIGRVVGIAAYCLTDGQCDAGGVARSQNGRCGAVSFGVAAVERVLDARGVGACKRN